MGASENENFCGFGLKSDGWKDLMSGKSAFVEAHKMKIFLPLL
ncbi:hypothetical protein [Okeania sp. SIO3I5]|nr:hypothetical protein [Okeania sp. SIO3I5]